MSVENWWNNTDWGKLKPVPLSLCPSQIPHGLPCDGTPASSVRGRWPSVWATARPDISVTWLLFIACFLHFYSCYTAWQHNPGLSTYLKFFGRFWWKLTLCMSLLLVKVCFISFVHFNSFQAPPSCQNLRIYCGVFRKIFTTGKKVMNKIV